MSSPVTTTHTITPSQDEFTDIPITVTKDDDAATVDDASNSPSQTKEKARSRVVRQSKNFWRRAMGCCKKSTPRTKIKVKEHQIAKRERAFGVEYIDLVRNQASEDQLQSALDSCLRDVGALVDEIDRLRDRIEAVSVETKSKLKPEPVETTTNKNDGIYPTGGCLYTGGDPKLEGGSTAPRSSSSSPPPPAGSFTIADDDDDDDEKKKNDSEPLTGPAPGQVGNAPSSPPMPVSAPPAPPAEDGDGFGSASSSPIAKPFDEEALL